MDCMGMTTKTMVLVATFGLILPPQLAVSAPIAPSNLSQNKTNRTEVTNAKPTVQDVSLHQGELRGQVLNGSGQPVANTSVVIRQGERAVGTTQTDAKGNFAVPVQQGGVYRVEASNGVRVVRAWACNTAPPKASEGILVVSNEGLVRGQPNPTAWMLSNPAVLAGIVLIAVGVPVLIYQNRDDRPPSS